jgi:hypothetical protein
VARAVIGLDEEDVATKGFVGVVEAALIGAQRTTIADQLIRSELNKVNSRIINGMSRTVDHRALGR